MSAFARLRVSHAALGSLVSLTYLSEDLESFHIWLGYCVAGLLGARLLLLAIPRALSRPAWLIRRDDNKPDLGLQNPLISKGFILGIVAALALTLTTGIMMQQTSPVESGSLRFVSTAHAKSERDHKKIRPNKVLKKIHEAAANGTLILVLCHISYLLLTRRKYATRMIFME